MKKFAILLTTAILGSAAFAAGTNMIQDEPRADSRPAGPNSDALELRPELVDELPAVRRQKGPGDPNANKREGNVPDDGFDIGSPQGESIQSDDPFAARAYGDEGRGMGSGGPGMGMGPGGGMGGPGFGYGGASGGREERGMDGRPSLGPGMGAPGGMSGPEGRYMRPRSVTRTIVEQRMEPLSKEEIAEMRKLADSTRLLHESKDEDARKKAADTIREQLNAQFDRDLKRREKELADIEARLKTLREQVEKRKAARDRIVSLRLDTIVNEADGLGFPADSVGSTNNLSLGRSFVPDDMPGQSFPVLPSADDATVPAKNTPDDAFLPEIQN